MKKSYILIAVAMIAALLMTGCKNNNKKSQEPTQEEIQAQKQELADSVLAKIDALAEEFSNASEKSFNYANFQLTEEEKLIKPDYLLEPSDVNKFVTKSQKVNALNIYLAELMVRKIYDMPLDEAKEAIAKLTLDLNYPIDYDKYDKTVPLSVIIKDMYTKCKENGELSYFWQCRHAVLVEIGYLSAQNPDLLFSKITPSQWEYYSRKVNALRAAREELSKYDEEMAAWRNHIKQSDFLTEMPEEERAKGYATMESAKQFRIDNKDKFIARRNALLQ